MKPCLEVDYCVPSPLMSFYSTRVVYYTSAKRKETGLFGFSENKDVMLISQAA